MPTTVENAKDVTEPAEEPWHINEFYLWCNVLKGQAYRPDTGQQDYLSWHLALQTEVIFHPSVMAMVKDHRPVNIEQLVMEWPRISKTDETRLSYTRTRADGLTERTIVTSIGKYLSRHWPHVQDHIRRDAQALYSIDKRLIVTTVQEMIRAVEDGPRSCMASVHGSISFTKYHAEAMRLWFSEPENYDEPDWSLHPYSCYKPELGWSMAVRWSTAGGEGPRIDGRALIYKDPRDPEAKSYYVRCYKRNMRDPYDGWSENDFALSEWLKQAGYIHIDGWPEGARIHTPHVDKFYNRIKAPYIDGCHNCIKLLDNEISEISTDRSVTLHECCNTCGWAGPFEPDDDDDYLDEDNSFVCYSCDGRFHDDDGRHVGRNGDTIVCENCRSEYYTRVRGTTVSRDRGAPYSMYYVHQDYAYYVENADFHVDGDYLPDGVVCTANCGYALEEDCVCDTDGEWRFREDCHFCEDTDEWVVARNVLVLVDDNNTRFFETPQGYEEARLELEDEKDQDEETEVQT